MLLPVMTPMKNSSLLQSSPAQVSLAVSGAVLLEPRSITPATPGSGPLPLPVLLSQALGGVPVGSLPLAPLVVVLAVAVVLAAEVLV